MNTALGLGVGFDKEVGIKFAGGFLVQVSLDLLCILCTQSPYAVHAWSSNLMCLSQACRSLRNPVS